MISNLDEIKKISKANEAENWRFRSWLKFHAPRNIDSTVKKLSQKYSAIIDCKQCANCCKSLEIVMHSKDLEILSKETKLSVQEFEKKYTRIDEDSDRVLNPPCPVLKNNLCSIYNSRPETCRTYPHLEESGFISRLIGVIHSLSICPIAFNTFQELKSKMNWQGQ